MLDCLLLNNIGSRVLFSHNLSSFLQGDRTQVIEKRFREFVLVAENAEAVLGAKVDTAREGSYQLLGDVLTRFSDHCTNTGRTTKD